MEAVHYGAEGLPYHFWRQGGNGQGSRDDPDERGNTGGADQHYKGQGFGRGKAAAGTQSVRHPAGDADEQRDPKRDLLPQADGGRGEDRRAGKTADPVPGCQGSHGRGCGEQTEEPQKAARAGACA